VQATVVYL